MYEVIGLCSQWSLSNVMCVCCEQNGLQHERSNELRPCQLHATLRRTATSTMAVLLPFPQMATCGHYGAQVTKMCCNKHTYHLCLCVWQCEREREWVGEREQVCFARRMRKRMYKSSESVFSVSSKYCLTVILNSWLRSGMTAPSACCLTWSAMTTSITTWPLSPLARMSRTPSTSPHTPRSCGLCKPTCIYIPSSRNATSGT